MKNTIRIVIGIVIFALVCLSGYFALNRSLSATAELYQTSPAVRGNIEATIGATGTVRANQTALLTWQTTGSVKAVHVKVGDQARKDDILAELSETSLAQSIILAEVDLLTAQRSLDDLKTSDTAHAQAELAVVQAEKALDEARTCYEGVNFARASDTEIEP